MPTAGIEGFDTAPVTLPPGAGRADSRLRRLKVAGRNYYMLVQRGSYADMAYDHGRLLAQEVESGVFPEIIASIGRGTDFGGGALAAAGRTLFHALGERIRNNVTAEFSAALDALAAGYHDGAANPRYTKQDVRNALLAIEIEDLADGIQRRIAIADPAVQAKAAAEAVDVTVAETTDGAVHQLMKLSPQKVIGDLVARIAHPGNRSGFGCTGVSVPAGLTRDGRHLHARNLDADLYEWNNTPAIFLADETAAGHKHKYLAFGTVGLIYPGGISGINEAGIAVSLHQLSTTQYRLQFTQGHGYLAPFLQQCVLRDAGTLAEAIAIVNAAENLAAWIIFCSDAKTGETVRIEFNGRETRVGAITTAAQSQTNHFLHPDLVERLFNADDAHYTPTLGKWLETRTRMTMVDAALAAAAATRDVDTGWAIDLLSSGQDPQLVAAAQRAGLDPASAGVQRGFGRVPRKAYGQLMTIVRGDPARAPGADEAWMTIGDRLPGCQGTLVGWRIDWAGFDLKPVDADPLRRTQQYVNSDRANWELSFGHYLNARVAVARPRDAAGTVLSRAPTAEENRQAYQRAEALLTEAISLAEQDRIIEIPYYYLRARVRHELADYAAAAQDWDVLRAVWAAQSATPPATPTLPVASPRFRPVLLEYEAALSLALAVVTEDKRRDAVAWDGRAERVAEAAALLAGVRQRYFGDQPAHFDLVAWIKRVEDLGTPGTEAIKLPEPEFVTVE